MKKERNLFIGISIVPFFFKRSKGITTTFILIILGIIGVAGFTSLFFAGEKIGDLISLIFSNFWLLIGGIIAVGITISMIAYFARNPVATKQALIMMGFSIATIVILVIFLPLVGGVMGWYQVDLTYKVYNEPFGPTKISFCCNVENFKKMGPFAMLKPLGWWPWEDVKATITTTCDGKEVHVDADGYDVLELTTKTVKRTVMNLPSGKECTSAILIECDECQPPDNYAEVSYTVPH